MPPDRPVVPAEGRRYPDHHDIRTGPVGYCQVCASTQLHLILDLGHQPLCDTLLTPGQLNEPEPTYPLRMIWCETCTGVQIDYCVDASEVYHPDYPYRSGISSPLAEYQRGISDSLIEKYALTPDDLVIDIGSNDGTLLSGFQDRGIRVLGVEPTNIARLALEAGIPTRQSFFDIATAREVVAEHGSAAVVTSTNVFAHVQALGEFVVGVYDLLEEGGVFVSETHYLLDVVRDCQFDTIYHEHLRTYSLRALIELFRPYDFTVTDVERGDRYGGNIRVHVTKGRGAPVSTRVGELLALEQESGLDRLETYEAFAERAKRARLEFMSFLIDARQQGKSIAGKSSPGRAATLLNYYGVDPELIPYLAELPTSLKLGMYLPGEHIPVVDERVLFEEQPDYVVMLAWHYADFIINRLREAGLRSDFVVPLPEFRIVGNAQM
jgi:C-methyltransferase C-terminal domain/Putative zinc binding domain/Methyltransferase domain